MFGDGIGLTFWINGMTSEGCCEFRGGPYLDAKFFGEGVGIAVKKDNRQLAEILNYGLEQVHASGRYEELFLRYFPHELLLAVNLAYCSYPAAQHRSQTTRDGGEARRNVPWRTRLPIPRLRMHRRLQPTARWLPSSSARNTKRNYVSCRPELCTLQDWVKATGERIIVIFEGRDAAGKGGTRAGRGLATYGTCWAQ